MGQGKPHNQRRYRFHRLGWAMAALLLAGCEALSSSSPNPVYRTPSGGTVSTGGGSTSAEVGVPLAVSVTVKDSSGFGISGIVPTVTAQCTSDAAVAGVAGNCVIGSTAGITISGCGATDVNGITACSVTSSFSGDFQVKVLSPVVASGGVISFFQLPRALSFATEPSSSAVSSTVFAQQPTVHVLDRVGSLINENTTVVTISLTSNTTGATLSGSVPGTVAAGSATFAGLKIDKAGSYTLTAISSDTAAAGVSSGITISAGTATQFGFVTQPSSSTAANTVFAQQPVVAVQDAAGNTVTGNSSCVISLVLGGGGVSDVLQGTTEILAASGRASFTGLEVATTAGGSAYTLTASSATAGCGFPSVVTSPLFTITLVDQPFQLAVSQNPGTAPLNQIWSTQPVVQVLDDTGALVTSDNATVVTIAKVVGTSGAGTLSGSTSVTVHNGQATFAGLEITGVAANAGTYNYAITGVSNGNVLSPASASQTINANGVTPSKWVFSTQPQNSSLGATMSAVTVEAFDANGFLCVNDNTDTVSLAISGGATLSGGGAVTLFDGVATFNALEVTTPAGSNQLTASGSGLTAATSSFFGISSFGTATQLVFTTEPANGGAVPSGTAITTAPVLAVEDAAGNIVVNDNSTLITLSGQNSCTLIGTTGSLAKTVTNGVANFGSAGVSCAATTTNASILATPSNSAVTTTAGSASFNVP